jgi:hypothetical protein
MEKLKTQNPLHKLPCKNPIGQLVCTMERARSQQQTLLSLVEWNTILSNSNEIYQGLF